MIRVDSETGPAATLRVHVHGNRREVIKTREDARLGEQSISVCMVPTNCGCLIDILGCKKTDVRKQKGKAP